MNEQEQELLKLQTKLEIYEELEDIFRFDEDFNRKLIRGLRSNCKDKIKRLEHQLDNEDFDYPDREF